MTDSTYNIANPGENAVVAALAGQAAEPRQVEPGTIYAIADGAGKTTIVSTDEFGVSPRRAAARRKVNDSASFNAYVKKHGTPASEVWADTKNAAITAILDAHGDEPGWEAHNVALVLEKSTPWLAWEQLDGKLLGQLEFAEFIDVRATDVRDPDPLILMEIAQHFSAHRNVEFESSQRIDNGQTQLVYKETIKSKVGEKGDLAIPDRITLAIKPFIGGPMYYVYARFRYRIGEGGALGIGYVLERPQEVLDAAFADILDEIKNGKPLTEDRQATDTEPFRAGSPGFAGIGRDIFLGRPA
jgi:uncharacterized protein YfdQ (DUF2303 family)